MKKRFLFILIIILLFTGCTLNFGKGKDSDSSVSQEKEKYYNYISMYVRDVILKINDGIEYHYQSPDTMLFIPAGNQITCVSDNILVSPFGNTWKYIYVGVYYDGEEYLYSVASKDEENYEIPLMTQMALFSYDYQKIQKVKENSVKEFINHYTEKSNGNKTYSIGDVSQTLKKFIQSNYPKVKNIVFIDPNECSYE